MTKTAIKTKQKPRPPLPEPARLQTMTPDIIAKVQQICGHAWHIAVVEHLHAKGWRYLPNLRWTTTDPRPGKEDLFLIDFLGKYYGYGTDWVSVKK